MKKHTWQMSLNAPSLSASTDTRPNQGCKVLLTGSNSRSSTPSMLTSSLTHRTHPSNLLANAKRRKESGSHFPATSTRTKITYIRSITSQGFSNTQAAAGSLRLSSAVPVRKTKLISCPGKWYSPFLTLRPASR